MTLLKKIAKKSASFMGALIFGTLSVVSAEPFLVKCAESTVESFDSRDVNHDGYITMVDAVVVSRYLNGTLRGNEYNQLDANQNLLVDYEDYRCVYSAVTGSSYSASFFSKKNNNTVSFPSITGTTLDPDASLTGGRTYRRYSFVTNSQLSNYTLYPNTSTIGSVTENCPDSILGDDDRILSYGDDNKAIVALTTHKGNTSGFSTGFIVGNHAIATAAHCVCGKTQSGQNVTITYPDSIDIETHTWYGTLTGSQLTPLEIHIPNSYCQANSANHYDYALIIVEEDLSNYPQFSVTSCYNRTETQYSSVPVIVNGCPGQIPVTNADNTYRRLYFDEGYIEDSTDKRCINYHIDTTAGQSGSPFYTITKYYVNNQTAYCYSALGIHTSSGGSTNFGVRFTKYHNQFYRNNPKITEALSSN